MSDSLTEIMKEMRDQPPPSAESLARIRKREEQREFNKKARREALKLYLYALLKDDFNRGLRELDFFFHDDVVDVLRELERAGLVIQKDYSWHAIKHVE